MRVFIVEDSSLIRSRLIEMITRLNNMEVVGESDDSIKAYNRIIETQPEVIILDVRLRRGNGIVLLHKIRKELPDTTIIMLTNYPYPQYREICTILGADYFFDKSKEFNSVYNILSQKSGMDME